MNITRRVTLVIILSMVIILVTAGVLVVVEASNSINHQGVATVPTEMNQQSLSTTLDTPSNVQVFATSIFAQQSYMQLPPGGQLYIYGYGTGGEVESGYFASGQYSDAVNSVGNIAASIAVTGNDVNSFQTVTGLQTIAGVSITGYGSYTVSYGINDSIGAGSASDTFDVSNNNTTAVFFALTGSEAYLSITGIPNLQIDAQNVNSSGWVTNGYIPIIVAQSQLNSGQYTATELSRGNSTDYAVATGRMADLIGVFLFTPQIPSTNSTNTTNSSNPFRVVASIGVGNNPNNAAYDPADGNVFVTNTQTGEISVINSTNNQITNVIRVGNWPRYFAYDPANKYMYVSNNYSDNISIINSMNYSAIGNITLFGDTPGIAYDPSNGKLYATEFNLNRIVVIDPNTDKIVSNISSGIEPFVPAVDLANGYVYVSNFKSNNVSVINPNTNKVVDSISVGIGANTVIYDPSNNFMYVANIFSDTISVINTRTNSVVDTIRVLSYPGGIAYDPQDGYIFTDNVRSNCVSVINTTTDTVIDTVSVGSYPGFVAYNPINGDIYVPNFYSDNVSVISPPVSKQVTTSLSPGGSTALPDIGIGMGTFLSLVSVLLAGILIGFVLNSVINRRKERQP